MYILFLVSALGMILTLPLQFLSVEHLKLEKRFGKEKGRRIGEICGIVSGWAFFIFWIGIWFSPQPRFLIPIFQELIITMPYINSQSSLFHLIVAVPFLITGSWLGLSGVKELSLKVSETHRPEKIVKTGVYSIVRHPQYLGGLLAHIGITLVLSAFYSLLYTPVIILIIYLIARKEEIELLKEFKEEYEKYREIVPMFIPKLRRGKIRTN